MENTLNDPAYQAALAEIERALAEEGDAPQSERFRHAVETAERYEAEHFPDDAADEAR